MKKLVLCGLMLTALSNTLSAKENLPKQRLIFENRSPDYVMITFRDDSDAPLPLKPIFIEPGSKDHPTKLKVVFNIDLRKHPVWFSVVAQEFKGHGSPRELRGARRINQWFGIRRKQIGNKNPRHARFSIREGTSTYIIKQPRPFSCPETAACTRSIPAKCNCGYIVVKKVGNRR